MQTYQMLQRNDATAAYRSTVAMKDHAAILTLDQVERSKGRMTCIGSPWDHTIVIFAVVAENLKLEINAVPLGVDVIDMTDTFGFELWTLRAQNEFCSVTSWHGTKINMDGHLAAYALNLSDQDGTILTFITVRSDCKEVSKLNYAVLMDEPGL